MSETGEVLAESAILGGTKTATNIQALELMAVIEAIRSVPDTQPVVVFTDHKTLVDVMAKPVRARCECGVNKQLWNQLRSLVSSRDVSLNWVRGHDGNKGNMAADRLARRAARAFFTGS